MRNIILSRKLKIEPAHSMLVKHTSRKGKQVFHKHCDVRCIADIFQLEPACVAHLSVQKAVVLKQSNSSFCVMPQKEMQAVSTIIY